jgi:hypothetical protein
MIMALERIRLMKVTKLSSMASFNAAHLAEVECGLSLRSKLVSVDGCAVTTTEFWVLCNLAAIDALSHILSKAIPSQARQNKCSAIVAVTRSVEKV